MDLCDGRGIHDAVCCAIAHLKLNVVGQMVEALSENPGLQLGNTTEVPNTIVEDIRSLCQHVTGDGRFTTIATQANWQKPEEPINPQSQHHQELATRIQNALN